MLARQWAATEFFLNQSTDHINVLEKSLISTGGHGLEMGRGPARRERNVRYKTALAGPWGDSRGRINRSGFGDKGGKGEVDAQVDFMFEFTWWVPECSQVRCVI